MIRSIADGQKQFENWEELNLSTWKAMTELYKAGKIKVIGVSNFMPHHLKALMDTEVVPMVDQIEFHPGCMQNERVDYCKNNDIQVEAWSLQHEVLPLPKSVTPSRIKENSEVFDFALAQEDMEIIDRMESFGGSGLDPDKIDF